MADEKYAQGIAVAMRSALANLSAGLEPSALQITAESPGTREALGAGEGGCKWLSPVTHPLRAAADLRYAAGLPFSLSGASSKGGYGPASSLLVDSDDMVTNRLLGGS